VQLVEDRPEQLLVGGGVQPNGFEAAPARRQLPLPLIMTLEHVVDQAPEVLQLLIEEPRTAVEKLHVLPCDGTPPAVLRDLQRPLVEVGQVVCGTNDAGGVGGVVAVAERRGELRRAQVRRCLRDDVVGGAQVPNCATSWPVRSLPAGCAARPTTCAILRSSSAAQRWKTTDAKAAQAQPGGLSRTIWSTSSGVGTRSAVRMA
jgi:hypothetical protein